MGKMGQRALLRVIILLCRPHAAHVVNSRFYISKIQHEVVYLINVIIKLSNKQYKVQVNHRDTSNIVQLTQHDEVNSDCKGGGGVIQNARGYSYARNMMKGDGGFS